MARAIRAAIWWRRVWSCGQKSGGVPAGSQPLMMPRALRASMAAQAGSAAGTSPKRAPQGTGPPDGDGDSGGLDPGATTLKVRTTVGAAA
jgi:hypothetical protein